jgi:5'-3' exonuclease
MSRLHLVDGTFELFRQHFSKRPDHRTPEGKPFKATAGVVQSLLWLVAEPKEAVTHIGVAFDNPIRSFRNDLFAGYKSDEGMLPELRAQFDDVEEAVRALGIVVWSMDRWEADDAMATAAARFGADVDQVRILTPDKDLGQCLDGTRVIQVDRIRDREIDEAAMTAAKGVPPAAIPDFLALVGDTADGYPGIDGWGEKSASILLSHYGTIEAIPDDPGAWVPKVRGAERLAASLAGHREEARLYKVLATLVRNVPLTESFDDLEWKGVPKERFEGWCAKTGLERLATRPVRWAEG